MTSGLVVAALKFLGLGLVVALVLGQLTNVLYERACYQEFYEDPSWDYGVGFKVGALVGLTGFLLGCMLTASVCMHYLAQ